MRNPKKVKAKLKSKAKPKAKKDEEMELDDEPSTSTAKVWRPGIDPVDEDEELAYDPTAYDCLHRFEVDWPCLSFDILKDDLGGPRSSFPHTVYLVCGTQAASARQNYVAFLKLAQLGQGRHGKKAAADEDDDDSDASDDDDDDDSDGSGDDEEEGGAEGDREMGDAEGKAKGKASMRGAKGEPPATFHYRRVAMPCGVNRIRAMPQQPALVAVWGDNAQVRLIDGSKLVSELAAETEPTAATAKGKGGGVGKPLELRPLASHSHSAEGYALDWSPAKPGRLASGDNRHRIHVWEPAEGGKWAVGGAHTGHEGAVEDLQWSPSEETVFASCGTDRSIRIWDCRERGRPMLTAAGAHSADVNVMSWNRGVSYMLASGADDGVVRIWDLRTFASSSAPPAAGAEGAASGAGGPAHVAQFTYHRSHVTSVEWCPYEGSMLASCSADNQLAVWDLALERDPEEEAALAPEGNAAAPEDLPAQLLFLHAGQSDLKELHWHPQIPGVIVSTAGDGFNLFKASNM
ncbi:hypothetical protein PLESTB_001796300 [Pleodorina starrii]|uniref:Glutamate-rich WD repeat-containing protein 1 n=1 Tax=Pleodorina starrii TaxID=330485 RepID=A0A9W6C0Q0_9CHLO|nr:hypothetical protein PLESTM_001160700 [Pleodorina starrii]GLC61727.1 hypothetical protein PLESTB_001796300 [Pleodorina starrii]GLC69207.1 hypothetical protein PLESTF_000802000 [Pleodorina starrii]